MKLIEGGSHIGVLNLLRGGGHQRGLRFKTVQRGDLAGERAQGCDLNVTFLGDLLEARIIVLQLIFFCAQLVVAGNFQQHAGIRAGDTGEAEESNRGTDYKYVEVLHGDGDLAQLAVVPAGHKKDVKAFSQICLF